MDELIKEASEKGLLESEYDNEYTREIGRLSYLGALYENEYFGFKYTAKKYVDDLFDDIETNLPNYLHKSAPAYFDK